MATDGLADGPDGQCRSAVTQGQHAAAVEAVHQPAQGNGAHAAQREECRDQRCGARIHAAFAEQHGHPVDEGIEDHQPHEVGQPQHQRAQPERAREHQGDAARRLRLGTIRPILAGLQVTQ